MDSNQLRYHYKRLHTSKRMFPDRDIHQMCSLVIGCARSPEKAKSAERQSNHQQLPPRVSIDFSRPSLVARISGPIINKGRINLHPIPYDKVIPKPDTQSDEPINNESKKDVEIEKYTLPETIVQEQSKEKLESSATLHEDYSKESIKDIVEPKPEPPPPPEDKPVQQEISEKMTTIPAQKVDLEDEWELLVKHQQKLANIEREQESLNRKYRQRTYREELLSQIERNKARSVCESYEKKQMLNRMKKREEEFNRVIQEKKEEEKRLKDFTRRIYQKQMEERDNYESKRYSSYRAGGANTKLHNMTADNALDIVSVEQQLYRKRIEDAVKRQELIYKRYANQMTPGANLANDKIEEKEQPRNGSAIRPRPEDQYVVDQKRTMQQMYKRSLDYQTMLKEQLKKRERKLSPEVVKMNKRDLDIYLNSEYSTIIEKMRKTRTSFDSKRHEAPTSQGSTLEERKEKAALAMEAANNPTRNDPIVNPLPYISNPYIARHLGLNGKNNNVLKGAALHTLQC